MSAAKAPPLPGEVWRGMVRLVDGRDERLCAIAPDPEPWPVGDATLRGLRWVGGDDARPLALRWSERQGDQETRVFRAWALSLARRLADVERDAGILREANEERYRDLQRALGTKDRTWASLIEGVKRTVSDLVQARKDYADACKAMALRVDLQARIRELEADLAAERAYRRDVP